MIRSPILVIPVILKEHIPMGFETRSVFWAFVSSIYATSQIVAGYAIRRHQKWGVVFSLPLCVATMIVAPTIVPFGVVDLILALIILVCLPYAYYGNGKNRRGWPGSLSGWRLAIAEV